MTKPVKPPLHKRVFKRIPSDESWFVRNLRLFAFVWSRRIEGWKLFWSEFRWFRRFAQFARFKKWQIVDRARKEEQVRKENASLPKPNIEERLGKLDVFFSLLLSPTKPGAVWVTQILLTVLALLPVGWLGYNFLRNWRIDNLYQASVVALSSGDLVTAWRTAHAAHLMRPDDDSVLRALFDSACKVGHPQALQWGKELVRRTSATLEDRLSLTRMAIESGDRELAERELAYYERNSEDNSEEARILRLHLTASRGRSGKAEALLQARVLLADGCDSVDLHRIYWSLCMDPADPEIVKEGLAHLRQFTNRSDLLGRESLRFLLQQADLDPEEQKSFAASLWAFEKPTRMDALLCMNANSGTKSIDSGSLYDRLISSGKKSNPDMGTFDVARNLARLGRKEEAVAYVVDTGGEQLSPACKLFFESIFSTRSGDTEQAQELLRKALDAASLEDLDVIRQLVQLHSGPNVVLALLERIEKEAVAPPVVRQMLALCYQRLGRDKDLEEILSRTPLPSEDASPQEIEQTCRLKALYGQNLPECRRLAEQLVTKYPSTLSYRYLLALCYHRSARPQEAHALLQVYLSGTPPTCPSQRLVGALSLSGVGRHAEAGRWLPTEQVGWLLEPELEMMSWVTDSVK